MVVRSFLAIQTPMANLTHPPNLCVRHKKQRDAADKYKSDRRSEKKIQKDVYGKFYIFKIIFVVVISLS